MFPQLLKKYGTIDIIGGKIADDQTAHTLQQYIGGVDFGIPGTPKADKIVIYEVKDYMHLESCLGASNGKRRMEAIEAGARSSDGQGGRSEERRVGKEC